MAPGDFVKHDQEKPKYYMVEPEFIRGIASVLTHGAKKYSPDNWKNYAPTKDRPESATQCYYSAMMRHVDAWRSGERYDPETGFHHLYHAGCCLMFMIWFDNRVSISEMYDTQIGSYYVGNPTVTAIDPKKQGDPNYVSKT